MPNDLLEYTHGLPISVNDLVWETHNNNNYYYLELARNTYVIYGDNKQPIGVCNFDINTGKFNFKIDHSDYLNIDISIVDTEIAKTPDFSMAHIIGSFISIYREINNNESPRSYNTFFYIISKESSLSHIIVEAKTFNFDTKRLTTFMKTHAVIDYFNESTPHYVFYNTATHGKNKSNHKSFSKCDSHTTTYFWRNYYYVYSLDEHNNRYFKTLKDAIDSIATTCLKADDSLKIKQVTVANNFVTKVYHNKNIIHKLIRSYIRNDMPNITNCIVYFNKCDQYKTHYGQSSGQYTRDGHVNDYDEHLNDYAHFVAKYINVFTPGGFVCYIDYDLQTLDITKLVNGTIINPEQKSFAFVPSYEDIVLLQLTDVKIMNQCPVSVFFDKLTDNPMINDYLSNNSRYFKP